MTRPSIIHIPIILFTIFIFCSTGHSQTRVLNGDTSVIYPVVIKPGDDETQKRILQLEDQIKAMKGQIDRLSSLIRNSPKV